MRKYQISNIKYQIKEKGFTLVEMLVAIGLFTVIVSFSLGAILSVFDANRRSQSASSVMTNLNFSLENMTRTVRFGDHYYCGISNNINATANCSNGGNSLSVTFEGSRIIYKLENGAIKISDNGGSSYTNITAPEVVIQHLQFYVFNTNLSDNSQPYVVAVIKGYVGNKPTIQSSFSIQTVMSQRELDFNP